jgi:hypothetical protein
MLRVQGFAPFLSGGGRPLFMGCIERQYWFPGNYGNQAMFFMVVFFLKKKNYVHHWSKIYAFKHFLFADLS